MEARLYKCDACFQHQDLVKPATWCTNTSAQPPPILSILPISNSQEGALCAVLDGAFLFFCASCAQSKVGAYQFRTAPAGVLLSLPVPSCPVGTRKHDCLRAQLRSQLQQAQLWS